MIIICLVIIIALSLILGFLIINNSNASSARNTTNNTTISNTTNVEHLENNYDASKGGNYLEGPEVDSHGVTKEEVMRAGGDVKYDEESGIYVMYDPKYGVYHD